MKEVAKQSDQRQQESERRGFNVTDANTRNLWWFAFGIAIFLGLTLAILAAFYGLHHRDELKDQGFNQIESIEDDWRAIDQDNKDHLTGYRWIDPKKGVVQVPIERAMELIEERSEAP